MANFRITLMLMVAITTTTCTLIQGQSAQDGVQHTGQCACPCNSAGAPGQPGVSGPQGLVGPQGPQGLTGAPGAPGMHGIPGQSCSQSSLKGVKGDRGPASTGEDGSPGVPGRKGEQGLSGFPGPKGNKGDQGSPGTSSTSPMSAFSARRADSFSLASRSGSQAQNIPFTLEDIDVGDDYDSTTGIFTCRIQGLYYFSVNLHPWFLSESSILFVLNGVAKTRIRYDAGNRGVMQSQSIIMALQVGDQVAVKAEAPTVISWTSDNDASNFNGYLIHAN